jgi:hypothetical protein
MVLFDASGEPHAVSTPKGDQRQYYINVRNALNGEIENPVHPVEAPVMAVLEAAVTSSETGTIQPLALTAGERAHLQ